MKGSGGGGSAGGQKPGNTLINGSAAAAPAAGSRFRNVTFRQLRLFHAVATHLSHSRAALELNLSQPAVSMQLSRLETELGVKLLSKSGRGMRLTPAGAELLQQTRLILHQVRIADEAVSTYAGGGAFMHLGVVPTANYFAPALLAEFMKLHPGLRIRLSVDRRDAVLGMLREHEIDLAIAGYPPATEEVEAEAFAQHPHSVVARAGHALSGRRGLPWTAIADQTLIFRERTSATRRFFEHLLHRNGVQWEVRMELGNNESIKAAVMAGMGISLLSAHTFQNELRAGQVTVLDLADTPVFLDWCILSRRNSPLNTVAGEFRDFVVAEGRRLVTCTAS